MGPTARLLLLASGALTIFTISRLDTSGPLALWGPVSVGVWFVYAALVGWDRMGSLELLGVLWGVLSACNFVAFLRSETAFQGWGDVYFFCGPQHEYCSCDFRWNLLGWWKAATVWNFSISTAVGLQKLALQLGLGGLLPGEEVVTMDSFISVCWRLVPYWLNNWEQNWGTECSSMLFEVPQFAIELLVILPCIQIFCSRLKILAAAQIRVVVPEQDAATVSRENVAVNIVKGHWEVDPSQQRIIPRLRSNLRIMVFVVCLLAVAALNYLWVPLQLEQESLRHHRASLTMEAGKVVESGDSRFGWTAECSVLDSVSLYKASEGPGPQCPGAVEEYIASLRQVYEENRSCADVDILRWSIRKHSAELQRMKDEDHQRMIPLIEIALAMMRFSCEKFFVLLTVYVNYLLFREPPPLARALVLLNNNLSTIFQHVVLYTFPAICWAYGAGAIFSSFVSLIFWGAPLMTVCRHFGKIFTCTVPRDLTPAAACHIEMMGGNCAICWGNLEASDVSGTADPVTSGSALPCGHAYHAACLVQWMDQCLAQHRPPKCPMCQADIEYSVRMQWPWGGPGLIHGNSGLGGTDDQGGALPEVDPDDAEEGAQDFLFGDPNLQGLLDDMPDIFEVVEDEGHVHRILGRQEVDDVGEDLRQEDPEGADWEGERERWEDATDEVCELDSWPSESTSDGWLRVNSDTDLQQSDELPDSLGIAGRSVDNQTGMAGESPGAEPFPGSTSLHQRHRGKLLSVGFNSTRTESSPGGGRLGIRCPNPEFDKR